LHAKHFVCADERATVAANARSPDVCRSVHRFFRQESTSLDSASLVHDSNTEGGEARSAFHRLRDLSESFDLGAF
jgi:hypothetical protein